MSNAVTVEINNLFNKKNIVLSKEELFLIAQYVFQEGIITIHLNGDFDDEEPLSYLDGDYDLSVLKKKVEDESD
jgi:hypothetical protein